MDKIKAVESQDVFDVHEVNPNVFEVIEPIETVTIRVHSSSNILNQANWLLQTPLNLNAVDTLNLHCIYSNDGNIIQHYKRNLISCHENQEKSTVQSQS